MRCEVISIFLMFCALQPRKPGGEGDGDLPAGEAQSEPTRDLETADPSQQDEDPRLGRGEEGGREEEGGEEGGGGAQPRGLRAEVAGGRGQAEVHLRPQLSVFEICCVWSLSYLHWLVNKCC